MKITRTTRALAAAAAIAGVGGFTSSPTALADDGDPLTHTLGEQAALGDGAVVQGWTVTDLKVSTDAIPYHVRGTLWEATATDEALRGSSTPVVSNLNARAADGETYRVLFQVATPQGVNPTTLPEGGKTTGKVYFDVIGDAPDSVVYNAGGRDLLLWLPAPVVPATGPVPAPGARATTVTPAASTPALPLTALPAAVPATPAPAAPATTNGVNAPTAPADIHGAGAPTSTPTDQQLPDSRDIHGTVPTTEGGTPGAPAPAGPTPAVPAPVAPGQAAVLPAPAAIAPAPGVAPAPAGVVPGPAVVAPPPAAAASPAGPNPVVGPTPVVIPAPTPAG